MKKILAVILVLCSLLSCACASELDSLSFEELIAFQQYITQEIMKRPEWKEVRVPSGDWTVGVDIPEGKYSIRPVKSTYISAEDTRGRLILSEAMSSSDDESIGKIELKTGYIVHVSGDVIFSPAKGLGF